jgi:hypothetical protein
MVHFLKSFQKGRICEILFKKGPKTKKSVHTTSPRVLCSREG